MTSKQEPTLSQEKGEKKKHRILKVVIIILIILVAIVCIALATFLILKQSGKSSLANKDSGIPDLSLDQAGDGANVPEGAISYNGKYYTYNEDMITILVLGIDNSNDFEIKDYAGVGGRADTIFLLNLDPKNHQMSLIPISRDTIADVDIYSQSMKYIGTDKLQLALAYTYGDGMNKSCEMTSKAVKNLFYGIPIHGYAAINLGAINALNEQVGGVEVTVLDDLTKRDPILQKGNTVRLHGSQAEAYIRSRMGVGDGTNDSRMARQKQYVIGFINEAKKSVSNNLSLVFNMYQTILKNMVTDITVDEATYLATVALDCQFQEDYIYNLPGKSVQGDTYMEYHPDQEALYQLVLDVFYNEVR